MKITPFPISKVSRNLLIGLFLLVFSIGFATEPRGILEDKLSEIDKRYHTFLFALKLMEERNVRLIVETGTARFGKKGCIGDGCSTLIFSQWASQNNAFLYTVDINKECLLNAERDLGPWTRYISFVHSDSVRFFNTFNQPIDFLYLDSYDFDINNPNPSQQHHLKEIIAAYPWLKHDSIVMIDDCDLPYGGKGKLAIDYLLKRNWKIVASGYQVILVRNQ